MIIRFFYNSSKSLFAKILFGAIILSFGLWGVGDIVRSYIASRTAIQVGKFKIPIDKLRYEYSQKKQNLRGKDGKPLSPEEIKRSDIKKIILDDIIAQSVEQETINQLGIVVPKISLAQVIRSLPEFQENGAFAERLYVNMLQQSSMSEGRLLQQIRNSISRNQLFHPIISGYKMPGFVREALGSVYETNKTIWIAKIDINKTKINEKIDDEALTQYYKNNADKYKKPELRHVALMKTDYLKFIDDIKVTEDEITAYLNEHKDILKSVETRDFDRFEFDTKEVAEATLAKLVKGIRVDLQPNAKNVLNVKKSDFPKYIADNLFSLNTGKYSDVYSVGGKFYIYKLTRVNKQKEKSKSEQMNYARNALLSDKVNSTEFYSTIRDIKNKIEDSLASGTDVDKVAKEFKSGIIEINDYCKQNGQERIKKIVLNDDTCKEIINSIDSLNENQTSPIIVAKDNENISYVVFVRNISKEILLPIDTIKSQVTKDYVADLKNKETLSILNDLIGETDNPVSQIKVFPGAKSYTVCKKDLLSNSDNKDLQRLKKDCPYSLVIFEALSVLKQNMCKFYRLDADTYLLFGVENFQVPKYASNTMKFMVKQFLAQAMGSDMYKIAQAETKNRQKISLHEKIINEAISSTGSVDGE